MFLLHVLTMCTSYTQPLATISFSKPLLRVVIELCIWSTNSKKGLFVIMLSLHEFPTVDIAIYN